MPYMRCRAWPPSGGISEQIPGHRHSRRTGSGCPGSGSRSSMAPVQDALAFRGRVASIWSLGGDVVRYRHVVIRQFGGPEVLQVVEDDLTAPRSGQALVKVLAADVGFSDVN